MLTAELRRVNRAYAQANLEEVRWRDWTVRVPPLATQLAISEQRGLEQRAHAIRQHLAHRESTSGDA